MWCEVLDRAGWNPSNQMGRLGREISEIYCKNHWNNLNLLTVVPHQRFQLCSKMHSNWKKHQSLQLAPREGQPPWTVIACLHYYKDCRGWVWNSLSSLAPHHAQQGRVVLHWSWSCQSICVTVHCLPPRGPMTVAVTIVIHEDCQGDIYKIYLFIYLVIYLFSVLFFTGLHYVWSV